MYQRSRSASQEISISLWNPKFHYRVENSPSLVLPLSQMNPAHVLVFSIKLNIFLPSTPRHSKLCISIRLSQQYLQTLLSTPMPVACLVHIVLENNTHNKTVNLPSLS
jgi:hypothetical protein